MQSIKITKKLVSLIIAGNLVLAPVNSIASDTKISLNNDTKQEEKVETKEIRKNYILTEDKQLYASYKHNEKDKQNILKKGTIVTSVLEASNGYILVYENNYYGWIEKSNLEVTNKTNEESTVNNIEKYDPINKTMYSFEELSNEEINAILDRVQNEKQTNRYMFRLYFPEANHDVAVYNSFTQATVDRKDAAGTSIRSGGRIIADHKNQGFDCIKKLVVDSSLAYTCDGEEIVEYKTSKKMIGKNTGHDLLDEQRKSVFPQNKGGLSLYTCNETWRNVTIVYLQPTGKKYTRDTKRFVK